VHQLDAGDRHRRITERLEAKPGYSGISHHSDTLFDTPVVLLNLTHVSSTRHDRPTARA
jgi:hypothetical protein